MKKLFIAILITCISVLVIFTGTSFIYAGTVTKNYGDVTLNNWGSGNFSDIWDLTQDDLVLSYTINMSNITTPGWAVTEVGLRQVGAPNLDPNEMGGWMQSNYQFGGSNNALRNNNDMHLLSKHGWLYQTYDATGPETLVTPYWSGNNHGFWFDRDGVDEWQDDLWGAAGTYNTGGIYNIVISYRAIDATTGTMFATINGVQQGLYTGGWKDAQPEFYPAGRSFTGNMADMQVFYGRGKGDGTVTLSNISVVGVLADNQGPITTNVTANPNPAVVSSSVTITANVDDTTTGGSNIASAEYKLNDDVTWVPLRASNSAFDEVSEDVTGSFTAPSTPGVHYLHVRGTDTAGNVGSEESTMFVVYDPTGGFVTGGGWIDSPAGAYIADTSLAGKATFGFVSKYLKGASVPTGNTEFRFKVAGLNFHSSSYDWLVVNQGGTNAQFKGTGTINGEGTYRFMLWAGDGTPDTFRIKIWEGEDNTVYDNGVNQAIGGGSIVVHKK